MTTLPDGLRQQFEALETRLWRTDTAIAVCGSAVALLSAFGLQFLSDRVWDTPGWFRGLLMLLALGVVATCLIYYGRRWIWGHRSIETLAAIVQKRYRRLGDRLLGIVELADVTRRPQNVSPALCEAAIRQVAGEASGFNFNDAVETRRSNRLKTTLVLLGIVIAAPWLLAPQACWNALVRLLQPASGSVQRYTFVSLTDLPGTLVVPHGEPFQIEVGIAAQHFLNPTRATARFERQPVIHAPLESGAARFQIPGQTSEGQLRLTVGDASRDISIRPMYRPELRELQARVEYPAYLKYPPAVLPVKSATLALVEGSRVTLAGRASRELQEAEASIRESEAKEMLLASVSGSGFETAAISFEEGQNKSAELRWTDEHGLVPAAPWLLKLESRPDEAPGVTVSGLAAAVAMLETEAIRVGSESSDDFGVREINMTWEIEKAPPTAAEEMAMAGNERISRGAPELRKLEGEWEFAPSRLGIRGDSIVLLRATARDYLPSREPASSGAYRVYVLGPESHAKLIHDELEKVLAKLDDIARAQEELLDLGQQLASLSPEELKKPENAAKLAEQAEAEKRLARQLKELAESAAETLKEGMRNKSMDAETLNSWAEHIQAMRSIAASGMPQASQQLSKAGQSPDQREKELKDALASEQKVLDELREIQKKAGETQDQMAQQSIAARLRKLGDAHGETSEVLTKLLPETAGLSTEDLPDPLKEKVHTMVQEQEQRRSDATDIQGEIERFFDRTKLEKYGDVAKSMEEKTMDAKLKALSQLIAQNTAATGIEQAMGWKTQFHEWADRIDAKDPSKSAEGKPGKPSPEQMKVFMELVRLKQREEALRARTMSLEKGKENNESYAKEVESSAGDQREMIEVATKIGDNPAFCPGPDAMRIVTTAMNDAAKQLEIPRTDKPAVDAETDVINLLDHLLQSQCKGSGMSGMAGMMGMGMGMGGSAGGSMAGGDTDRTPDAVTGRVSGDTGPDRTAEKIAGADPNHMPAEFREALQSYYQNVERESR